MDVPLTNSTLSQTTHIVKPSTIGDSTAQAGTTEGTRYFQPTASCSSEAYIIPDSVLNFNNQGNPGDTENNLVQLRKFSVTSTGRQQILKHLTCIGSILALLDDATRNLTQKDADEKVKNYKIQIIALQCLYNLIKDTDSSKVVIEKLLKNNTSVANIILTIAYFDPLVNTKKFSKINSELSNVLSELNNLEGLKNIDNNERNFADIKNLMMHFMEVSFSCSDYIFTRDMNYLIQEIKSVDLVENKAAALRQKIMKIISIDIDFFQFRNLGIRVLFREYSILSNIFTLLNDISSDKYGCLLGLSSDEMYQLKVGCFNLITYLWIKCDNGFTKQYIANQILKLEQPLTNFLAPVTMEDNKSKDVATKFTVLLAEIKKFG